MSEKINRTAPAPAGGITASRRKTTRMVQIALLSAIIVLLTFTPLGFIPLGIINATTIHIPVIIGAILLGPAAGGFLGGVFGLSSMLINTVRPGPSSFVFSPFYAASVGMGGARGILGSIAVCMIPRILIGVAAGLLFRGLSRIEWMRSSKTGKIANFALCGVAGAFTNTLLVMSGIYFIFGEAYAMQVKKVAFDALLGIIMGIVGVNGTLEAIVAGILTAAITPLLMKLTRRIG